uniref:Putative ovule protein n=1 Tax=Solanum chacoense TaxID=4108 RepID=A0A0V0GPZ6_SOLCH
MIGSWISKQFSMILLMLLYISILSCFRKSCSYWQQTINEVCLVACKLLRDNLSFCKVKKKIFRG